MAEIRLDRVWLLDPADPGTPALAVLMAGTGRSFDSGVRGSVRRYANGTRRSVRQKGRDRGVEVPLHLTPAQHAQVEAWADGRTLLYRDGLGNGLWCAAFAAPYEPTDDGRGRIVDLRLAEVTHSEAV